MNRKSFTSQTAFKKTVANLILVFLACLLSYAVPGSKISKAADIADDLRPARTIEIVMDALKFDPKSVAVTAGETVRFVVYNRGEIPHDFTIGTKAMQQARRSFIRVLHDHDEFDSDTNASHAHDHPNALIVPPGLTKELVWTFKKTRNVEFGCNVPLHYEGGMHGTFSFNESVASQDVSTTSTVSISSHAPGIQSGQAIEQRTDEHDHGLAKKLSVVSVSVCFKPQINPAIDSKCYDLTLKEVSNLLSF